ncbi:hypothetical protein ACKWTF_015994 [Chironomus riparius]
MLQEVQSEEDFNDKISSAGNLLVVVDFHATWCGPCKNAEPKLEKLIESNKDLIMILKVDIDKIPELKKRFSIKYVPTFIFFWNGEKLDGVVDEADVRKVEKYVDKYLISIS